MTTIYPAPPSITIKPKSQHPAETHWTQLKNEELQAIIDDLQSAFQKIDEKSRPEGYVITFGDRPNKGVTLSIHGQGRKTVDLSGVPAAIEDQAECPFCTTTPQAKSDETRAVKQESTGIRSIQSRSDQLLIIPKKHYPHWFSTPRTIQLEALKSALQKRQEHTKKIKCPLHMHCGSAGGQTVFHLHLRTGIYKE